MPRVLPLPDSETGPELQAAYDQHCADYHSRITNMKATLGRNLVAFRAYMEWYPLYQELLRIVGPHSAPLYAWAVSEAADCPLCTTYFRKIIIERGEIPDALVLTAAEQQLLTFGATVARNKGFVPEEVFATIEAYYTPEEIVVLSAFAGIMIATNIFNNILGTQIDEYLLPFRSIPGDTAHA
jgi:alkylhydroperoxidase family enzyme